MIAAAVPEAERARLREAAKTRRQMAMLKLAIEQTIEESVDQDRRIVDAIEAAREAKPIEAQR